MCTALPATLHALHDSGVMGGGEWEMVMMVMEKGRLSLSGMVGGWAFGHICLWEKAPPSFPLPLSLGGGEEGEGGGSSPPFPFSLPPTSRTALFTHKRLILLPATCQWTLLSHHFSPYLPPVFWFCLQKHPYETLL